MYDHVVIVGGSAGGLSTAQALRRHGFGGRITVVDAERHGPYDRPPLSKGVLTGTHDAPEIALASPDALARLDLCRLDGTAAVALSPAEHTVSLSSGETLGFDALVVATGLVPRQLRMLSGLDGHFVLRSFDDALALRDRLRTGARLVVVGAGVLGTEVAAAGRKLGLQVTMVGMGDLPLAESFGPSVGERILRLHTSHGVVYRGNVAVVDAASGPDGITVHLSDGSHLAGDVVVTAIGAVPATGWLDGSGLDLRDGVVCDEYCRAAPDVFAVGDVAAWHHPALGRIVRVEHRMNAIEQAVAVAATIVGEPRSYAPVPFAWTDQYDVRIHSLGLPAGDAEVVTLVDELESGRSVHGLIRNGRLEAVVGWNALKLINRYRAEIFTSATGLLAETSSSGYNND